MNNFVKTKASPPKNSIFLNSTPKEILNLYNLPLENSMVPQPRRGGGGGGGGGRGILNAIAHFSLNRFLYRGGLTGEF